jgi:hypothetical protein
MRRSAVFVGIAVASLVLGVAPAAWAANPNIVRVTQNVSFSDPDFCGTGEVVDATIVAREVHFLSPHQDVDYAQVTEATISLTNPANGVTVVNHFAGRLTTAIVSGDPSGTNTQDLTQIGLNEQFRLVGGRILSMDAGYLVTRLNFINGGEFVSQEILVSNGPHPDAESGFAFLCEVIPGVLGL